MEFATRQEADLRSKEKRDTMRQLVYDNLNKKDLALYNAHQEAKRGIRDSLHKTLKSETALQMEQLKQH
eukprot:12031775-Heterocapsa_arctica.AAC.1